MSLGLAAETKPLLRPHQVEEMMQEERRLEDVLSAPPHIANQLQDRAGMARQLRRIKQDREAQTPEPFKDHELDAAAREVEELRERWLVGMPTQAEMRRNPAGAVDKHRLWERRNKPRIARWKHLMLRLHASRAGAPGHINDERDLANIERFRPVDASHEINMHNEQIQGRDFHMPYLPQSTVMSDAEEALLKDLDPETHAAMALLPAEAREKVLAVLRRPEAAPKARKGMSPEKRAEASERMKALRARQLAEKVMGDNVGLPISE